VTDPLPPPASGTAHARIIRAVPARAALTWFAEAMRLVKRGPVSFAALGFIVVLASLAGFVLEGVPIAGFVVDKLLTPLLAAGLLFASLAADRGERPLVKHAVAAFVTPASAQAAVVLASLATFACEAYAAWRVADINLFALSREASSLPTGSIIAIYVAGVLASLPLTFVPFAAMFDGNGIAESFAISVRAFVPNIPALLLYGAVSLGLLLLGLATMGLALVLVLPLIAAASYAAWKDIFSVPATAAASSGRPRSACTARVAISSPETSSRPRRPTSSGS